MRSRLGTVIAALLALAVAGARAEDAKERPAKPITGQCHCGRVKYRVQGPVVKCSYCDCGGCQRATGRPTGRLPRIQGARVSGP